MASEEMSEMAKAMINYLLEELEPKIWSTKKDALTTFQEFFFRSKPKLKDADIKTLLLGDSSRKGLCSASGQISWKNFRLNNSSILALKLLIRLLDPTQNPDYASYIKHLTELDASVIMDMRLPAHLYSSRGDKAGTRYIFTLLKRYCPRVINAILERDSDMDPEIRSEIETIPAAHDVVEKKTAQGGAAHDEKKTNQGTSAAPSFTVVHRQPSPVREEQSSGGIFSFLSNWLLKRPAKEELEKKGVLLVEKIFARNLQAVCDDNTVSKDGVPIFLKRFCLHLLQPIHVTQVGLFRVSGDQQDVSNLKSIVNRGDIPDLDHYSPHAASGVIKLFFRLMLDPLLNFDKYELFIDLHRKGKLTELNDVVATLPRCNRTIIEYLMRFLARVAQYSEANKMSSSNLGIVFAPNILRPRVETYESVARDTPVTIGVIKCLIDFAAESLGSKEEEEIKEELLRNPAGHKKSTSSIPDAVAAQTAQIAAITALSMAKPDMKSANFPVIYDNSSSVRSATSNFPDNSGSVRSVAPRPVPGISDNGGSVRGSQSVSRDDMKRSGHANLLALAAMKKTNDSKLPQFTAGNSSVAKVQEEPARKVSEPVVQSVVESSPIVDKRDSVKPSELPLPPGWSEHTDSESKRVYYYFAETETSSWERPVIEPSIPAPPEPQEVAPQRVPMFGMTMPGDLALDMKERMARIGSADRSKFTAPPAPVRIEKNVSENEPDPSSLSLKERIAKMSGGIKMNPIPPKFELSQSRTNSIPSSPNLEENIVDTSIPVPAFLPPAPSPPTIFDESKSVSGSTSLPPPIPEALRSRPTSLINQDEERKSVSKPPPIPQELRSRPSSNVTLPPPIPEELKIKPSIVPVVDVFQRNNVVPCVDSDVSDEDDDAPPPPPSGNDDTLDIPVKPNTNVLSTNLLLPTSSVKVRKPSMMNLPDVDAGSGTGNTHIHKHSRGTSLSTSLVYSHNPPTDIPKSPRAPLSPILATVPEIHAESTSAQENSNDDARSEAGDENKHDDQPALPYPWVSHLDPSCNQIYYYNTETEESTWIKPVVTAPPAVTSDKQEVRRVSVNLHSQVLSNIANSIQSTSTEASVHTVAGSWNVANLTSGGSYPDSTWWQNPQYKLTVSKSPVSLKFSLTQTGSGIPHVMGLIVVRVSPDNSIFKMSSTCRLLSITDADDFLVMGPFREAKSLEVETIVKTLVPLGDYANNEDGSFDVYIIPSLDYAGKEGSFSLNILCDVQSTLVCVSEPLLINKTFDYYSSSRQGWPSSTLSSRWTEDESGGCYPNFSSWRANPQFTLSLSEDSIRDLIRQYSLLDESSQKSSSIQVLDQDSVRIRGVLRLMRHFGDESIAVGFYIFTNLGPASHQLIVKDAQIMARSDFVQTSVVSAEFILDFSTVGISSYVLVPSTYIPSTIGDFSLTLCTPAPLNFSSIDSSRLWNCSSTDGIWTEETAGGCRNYETWSKNPQFKVEISKSTNSVVIVSQAPGNNDTDAAALLPIGFYVLNSSGETVGKGAFSRAIEVSCQVALKEKDAPYIIVPCTFDPNRIGCFTLMMYVAEGNVSLSRR